LALWSDTRNNIRYKINDIDHPPPHCHVLLKGRRLKVSLETFAVLKPRGRTLPPMVRQYLKEHQLAMLEAWQLVHLPEEP
jgi:hypothetical protein